MVQKYIALNVISKKKKKRFGALNKKWGHLCKMWVAQHMKMLLLDKKEKNIFFLIT